MSHSLNTLKIAAWLGWKIEFNWADPFVFAIYSLIRPITAAAIVVVMYSVITGGRFQDPLFAYMMVGTIFYRLVGQLLMGIFWTIFDDREHYKTVKYIYTSPIEYVIYLIGRSFARLAVGTFEVIVLLVFSVLFFHLPISFASIDWGLLLITLLIGIFHISFLGLILAGISLHIARHSDFLGELVAGAMYFFTGAVFPLDTLEPVFRTIGLALPITYWLELIRRAMLGSALPYFPTLGKFTIQQLMLILVLSTIFFGIVSLLLFKDAERRAKEKGMIDMVTNY
ncbi:MAG TPA: ABC transporter permease [Bellilinea sp.]|nr:ABC transporter permease [Bellilinea sp.]